MADFLLWGILQLNFFELSHLIKKLFALRLHIFRISSRSFIVRLLSTRFFGSEFSPFFGDRTFSRRIFFRMNLFALWLFLLSFSGNFSPSDIANIFFRKDFHRQVFLVSKKLPDVWTFLALGSCHWTFCYDVFVTQRFFPVLMNVNFYHWNISA